MADFDPYYKWLGIPTSDHPINRYSLLGIPVFTDDEEVIENAAAQRISHVRTFTTGQYANEAQKILKELSTSRICLLNPDLKFKYDQQLRAKDTEKAYISKSSKQKIYSASELIAVIEKSCLFSPQQLTFAKNLQAEDAQSLAHSLIKEKLLTVWQAKQMLGGRYTYRIGKYVLLEKLGEGAMGVVYKAKHLTNDRLVAIKFLSGRALKKDNAVERFHREIRAVSALTHPNIVCAIDADQVGDIHLLVMEYIPGHDLKSYIAKYEQLPVIWSCEVIRQIAMGLQYAHETGLIHRDIKPGNILVLDNPAEDIQVKILDLGFARFTSETHCSMLSQTNKVLGTIDYIAPELLKDSVEVDIRADIYSLGCTLFKMLTGEVPFKGDTLIERLLARTKQEAPRASILRGDIPTAIDSIIRKMMRTNPDERFQTPAEVVDAISLSLSGEWDEQSNSIQLDLSMVEVSDRIEADNDGTLSAFLGDMEEMGTEFPQSTGLSNSRTMAKRKKSQAVPILIGGAVASLLLILFVFIASQIEEQPSEAIVERPAINQPAEKESDKEKEHPVWVPEDPQERESIWSATATGNLETIQYHLDAGVDVNATFSLVGYAGSGSTPLHMAILANKHEIFTFLVNKGANINARANDQQEGTPLHWAIMFGRYEMAKRLIDLGCQVSVDDKFGQSPIDLATSTIEAVEVPSEIAEFVAPPEHKIAILNLLEGKINNHEDKPVRSNKSNGD